MRALDKQSDLRCKMNVTKQAFSQKQKRFNDVIVRSVHFWTFIDLKL